MTFFPSLNGINHPYLIPYLIHQNNNKRILFCVTKYFQRSDSVHDFFVGTVKWEAHQLSEEREKTSGFTLYCKPKAEKDTNAFFLSSE